ncbi:MAG: alkaline phosphatase [Pseudomonadota bacterium]|jgi:alkaline phosphatase D
MHYLDLLNRKQPALSRRSLLRRASFLASAALLPGMLSNGAKAQTRLLDYPFKLGVASGDPLSDGFVIWTRLAPFPTELDYGMDPEPVLVNWQVAERDSMANVVMEGTTLATPEMGHSVHVDLRGLRPGRDYFYRFRVGDYESRIGRAITAPVVGSPLEEFRFAFVSCQHYERGYYPAYRDLVEQDPRLVVFLGDYMYEGNPGRAAVRRHEGPEPVTLAQYRARYATYKLDANLQAAHAHTSWAFTWDDHEVDNNYANDNSQDFDDVESFLRRRAAAYQAYYETMPLRSSARPRGPALDLYQRLSFGDLLDINILDDRQYRSEHPCDWSGSGVTVDPELCSELNDPSRTMLGEQQQRWLEGNLTTSRSRWNVIAQQTLFAEFNRGQNGRTLYSTDGWGGYPAARDRLVRHIATSGVSNPVFIGGDVHANWVTDIKEDWSNPQSRTVASEFVGTSITSSGGGMELYDVLLPQNPHVKFIETRERGYNLCTVTPGQWRTEHRSCPDDGILNPDTRLTTMRSFVVENGRPGAVQE